MQAQQGRTTLIVAHRLSTIRDATRIFVFSNGEIVEQGTHDELMSARGTFYRMVLAQQLDDAPDEHKPTTENEVEGRIFSKYIARTENFILQRKWTYLARRPAIMICTDDARLLMGRRGTAVRPVQTGKFRAIRNRFCLPDRRPPR